MSLHNNPSVADLSPLVRLPSLVEAEVDVGPPVPRGLRVLPGSTHRTTAWAPGEWHSLGPDDQVEGPM